MSRVPQVVVNPQDPQSITEHLFRVQRVVDGRLEFGSPQDPRDPASATIPDGASHNGIIQNIMGSWFELSLGTGDLAVDQTCTHNLGIPIVSASTPNVRWIVFGLQHNAAGAGAGSTISAVYEGGTVGENAIVLRFYAAARTVNDANPLKVTLFFVPVVR